MHVDRVGTLRTTGMVRKGTWRVLQLSCFWGFGVLGFQDTNRKEFNKLAVAQRAVQQQQAEATGQLSVVGKRKVPLHTCRAAGMQG